MSNYNTKLQINNIDLQHLLQTLQNKAVGEEQVTPEISVASNGLITATAGSKSSTYQLAFQPAKTIIPSATSQIAVSSGYYTGGDVTVAGDSNLIAGNIKKNVSIFGVTGIFENNEDAIIDRTIGGTYINDKITNIGNNAFANCTSLTTVNFPICTNIGINAFANCTRLTTVDFPNCSYIGNNAFRFCYSLTTVSFPNCTNISIDAFAYCSSLISVNFPNCSYIGSNAFRRCCSLISVDFPNCSYISYGAFASCTSLISVDFPNCSYIGSYAFKECTNLTIVNFSNCSYISNNAFYSCTNLTSVNFSNCSYISNNAFYSCTNLTSVNFPVCTTIGNYAFRNCTSLTSVTLGTSTVCTLANSNAFSSTPMSTTGWFYVPASLLASYQTATNWTYYSSRFSTIESLENNTSGNLITFIIDTTEYQAEEGMTWGEWVESDYNTNPSIINIDSAVYNSITTYRVEETDIIEENDEYVILF